MDATKRNIRIAAAILASLIALFASITYLSYSGKLTSTDTVNVTAPRAGLMTDKDAKVKYRGIQIGKVKDIALSDDQAVLTLAIDSDQLGYVPSNAPVRIASNTIFGAKSVEFLPPQEPSGTSLRPGAHIAASSVQLEVNTLFQTLVDVLDKIDPVELNATLSAISEGLRGHGDDLGATLVGLNQYLGQLNPKLPTLQTEFVGTAAVGNIYADAGPDLLTIINEVPHLKVSAK